MIEAASSYPLLDAMWTVFVVFGWIIWFWLLISICGDLFRRHDLSGWGKAGWLVMLLVLPFVGVLIYLIAQGRQMAERRASDVQAAQTDFDNHVRSVASSGNGHSASEIGQAKELLDSGAINKDEFETLKRKALAG
jgi:apolipoprotein N-acyltransferase